MGSGIAQVAATAGFDVTVLEVEQKYLDKGFAGIDKSLAKFAERPPEKGGITSQQKDAIRARLKGTTNKQDLADCDIVIEAIIENVEEKKKMYASLDGIVKKRRDFCFEHVVDFHHRTVDVDQAPRALCRTALFQPRAVDEVGRGCPDHRNR